jgi:hypothetical protein
MLASALSRLVLLLGLTSCPEILECLFHVPKLECGDLLLDQARLSALECQRLGALVQESDPLKSFTLQGSPIHVEEPQILVESLIHLAHLQEQRITETKDSSTTHPPHGRARRDPACGPGDHDHVVETFLPPIPPKRVLKSLRLTVMHLKDCHFLTIVQALPSMHLEELDVSNNDIDCPGILALAEHLPRIHSLKKICLHSNPWENDSTEDAYEECWDALLQGLRWNYSIEVIDVSNERLAQVNVARNYCYLNWAGRRLLATPTASSSSMVPLGLWPLVLERAWKENDHVDDSIDDPKLRLSSIFFFLQNSPVLSLIGSEHSIKNRPTKKNKTME